MTVAYQDSTKAKAIGLAQQGVTPSVIAIRLGVGFTTVSRWLKRRGTGKKKSSKVDQEFELPRRTADQIWFEYLSTPCGSKEASELLDELRRAPVSVGEVLDDSEDPE